MFMINNDKQTKKNPKIKTPPPTKKKTPKTNKQYRCVHRHKRLIFYFVDVSLKSYLSFTIILPSIITVFTSSVTQHWSFIKKYNVFIGFILKSKIDVFHKKITYLVGMCLENIRWEKK